MVLSEELLEGYFLSLAENISRTIYEKRELEMVKRLTLWRMAGLAHRKVGSVISGQSCSSIWVQCL